MNLPDGEGFNEKPKSLINNGENEKQA